MCTNFDRCPLSTLISRMALLCKEYVSFSFQADVSMRSHLANLADSCPPPFTDFLNSTVWNGSSEASASCTNVTDEETSLHKLVAKQASDWSYYCTAALVVPGIPLALILGKWSDENGRRRVLILGSLGGLILYGGTLLYHYLELPLYTLVLASKFRPTK